MLTAGEGWTPDIGGSLASREGYLNLINRTQQPATAEVELYLTEILSTEEVRARYAREVEAVDESVGELLDFLEAEGLLEKTLIVLTSDHGEGLGQHGVTGHIEQVYDSMIHVPLILWRPGLVPEGKEIEQSVALVDLYPTLFDLLDISWSHPLRGESLFDLIHGKPSEGSRVIYSETYPPEARESSGRSAP